MDVKKNCKMLWDCIKDDFDMERIEEGFADSIEGFEYNPTEINNEMIDALSEDEARTLFFDIGYMAVNELFGGDFGTWYDVLESLGFDAETIEFLDY